MSPYIDMDHMFDLDLALTTSMEEYDSHNSEAEAAAAVDGMPTVILEGCGGDCLVCMEELGGSGAAKRAPCAHVFHETCISRWLSIHNSCPLCRRPLLSH